MNNQQSQEKDLNLTKQELIKLYVQYKIACDQLFSLEHLNLIKEQIQFYHEEYKKFPLEIQLKGFENWNIDNFSGLVLLKKEIEKKDIFNKTPDHLKYILIEKEQEEELEKIKKDIMDAYYNFNNADNIYSIQQIPFYLDVINLNLELYEKFPLQIQVKGFKNWNISGNKKLILLKNKVEKLYLLSQSYEEKTLPETKKRL